jgi:hypothetical protein
MRIMVWASIADDKISDLFIMRRDADAANQGYTQNSVTVWTVKVS